ncbi:hypothetical protein NE865_13601 [Phthorimaea operculella]|nr:hypothetical protein NE865_13601 [Phthorimaea operculella]
MCCCGSAFGELIANILYVTQRLATGIVLTALVGVLITTLLVMLSVGVGLGYHYCLVEHKTLQLDEAYNTVSTQATTNDAALVPQEAYNVPPAQMHSDDEYIPIQPGHLRFLKNRKSFSSRKENEKESVPEVVVPLNINVGDFSLLLAKIRGMHKNVTVHFVNTS